LIAFVSILAVVIGFREQPLLKSEAVCTLPRGNVKTDRMGTNLILCFACIAETQRSTQRSLAARSKKTRSRLRVINSFQLERRREREGGN
jgi:hypothetical protein